MRIPLSLWFLLSSNLPSLTWADVASAGEAPAEITRPGGALEKPLRVLVLYGFHRILPASQEFQRGLWTCLDGRIREHNIVLFEEYLEVYRLPADDQDYSMVSYLEKRYQEISPDVVLSVGPDAVNFAAHQGSKIFPSATNVYTAIREDEFTAMALGQPEVSVFYRVGARSLMELVAEMLPGTREILLVGGETDFDEKLLSEARRQLEGQWEVSEIVGMPPMEMAVALSGLRRGTVVLFTNFFRDWDGATYVPRNVLKQIAEKSPVPVFSLFDTGMGTGATGVSAVSSFELGRRSGEVIESLASKQKLEPVLLMPDASSRLMFDSGAMLRYGLNVDKLPADAEVFFKKLSFYESSPATFWGGLLAILMQFCLILALLHARRKKTRTEGEAMEMERYFSAVFMGSPSAMAVIQARDGVFRNVNPAWEQLLGISRDQVVGQSSLELTVLSEGANVVSSRGFHDSDEELANYELQIRSATGRVRNVAIYSKSIMVAGEGLKIITMVDINDRVEAEQLRSNVARDNRVAQMGQVSAWIVHQINQPLGAILNDAEAGLMLLDLAAEENNELREVLAEIKAENHRISAVVERVRVILGNHRASQEQVALKMIISEVTRVVSPEAVRRSVDVRVLCEHISEEWVMADRILLIQVFLNLVFNAIDAVADMPIARRVVTLRAKIVSEGKRIEFSVCDRGSGIALDQLEQIFDYFYTTKPGGMGLGLAISRSIVEGCHGELSVENRDNGGTCFYLKLPLGAAT